MGGGWAVDRGESLRGGEINTFGINQFCAKELLKIGLQAMH